jgi:hypothetical protein
MHLKSLDQYDQRTAQGVLAAAILTTAPSPGIGEPPTLVTSYSHQAATVLSEIRAHLRIGESDDSAEARTRIDNALSSTLKDLILNQRDQPTILNRLGQSGRLAPSQYEVIQTRQFSDLFNSLGVSTNHVEDAVKHPDDHQHLMTEGMPEFARTLSLFVKLIRSSRPENNNWLLVQTNRVGLQQIVQAAWRVYPTDVDLTAAAEPLDALRAFANTFGCPISVGGDAKALFVEPKKFPFDAEVRVDWTDSPADVFVNFSKTMNDTTKLFMVGLAYCIDLKKYRACLEAHDVKLRERKVRAKRDLMPA